MLYTDGLVESRVEDIDSGIRRVLAVLTGRATAPLPDLVAAVTSGAADIPDHDDVAVLAVRVPR